MNAMNSLSSLNSVRLSASTLFVVFCLLAQTLGCSSASKSVREENAVRSDRAMQVFNGEQRNSAATLKKPYVVLVSIDGYRHDYNTLFSPPNLSRFADDGVAAASLKPVYPSKTFPNHYSLVTGLTADHHGIVSNEFFDSSRDAMYSLPDRKAVEDGSWYFGEPLWITAGQQGMLSASYFWVGSEANIRNKHPNFYYRYDDKAPYEARVDQVLAWLKLPEDQRPHFITLYFEAVDSAAHRHGVNSQQTRDAVALVDRMIGRLRDGVSATGLPVNIVVVSDHGMEDVDAKKVITLDETPEAARVLAKFRTVGRGPQMLLYLNPGENPSQIAVAERVLSKGAKHHRVWRREQMVKFGYSSTPRTGDLIIEPDQPFLVGMRGQMPHLSGANHGWDAGKFKNMHGVFFAVGPSFKQQSKIPSFENIHVYPLLLEVLGLKQSGPIDGRLEPTRGALRATN